MPIEHNMLQTEQQVSPFLNLPYCHPSWNDGRHWDTASQWHPFSLSWNWKIKMFAYPTFQWSCGPVLRKKTWVLRDSGIAWRAGMTFSLFFDDHPALEGWSYMSSCVNPSWTLLILKTNINVMHRNVLPIMYVRMVKYILLLGKTNLANTNHVLSIHYTHTFTIQYTIWPYEHREYRYHIHMSPWQPQWPQVFQE